jgi:hypothetical protein
MPPTDDPAGAVGGAGRGAGPAPTSGVRTVRLPEEVVRALEQRMKGSSFESVDVLIAFILGRLVDHAPGDSAFSEEDERILKDRLRSLGYID